MRNSDRSWLALAVVVTAYDLIATDDEQLTTTTHLPGIGKIAVAACAGSFFAQDDPPQSCHRIGPRNMPLEPKGSRHGEVAVPIVAIARVVTRLRA